MLYALILGSLECVSVDDSTLTGIGTGASIYSRSRDLVTRKGPWSGVYIVEQKGFGIYLSEWHQNLLIFIKSKIISLSRLTDGLA